MITIKDFIKIEPGTFLMGSLENEPDRWFDEKQHQVALTQPFYMAETTVTQEQWKEITGENPSYNKKADHPVTKVSWNDAQEFIEKLNSMNIAPAGWKFDLPTEAQWEYCCRAGKNTAYSFGDRIDKTLVNFGGSKTVPVRSFPPNPWGLYEMHGNIWEWCRDGKRKYTDYPVVDPVGPSDDPDRVFRGGSWSFGAQYCRSADRYADRRDLGNCYIGLRLVLIKGNEYDKV